MDGLDIQRDEFGLDDTVMLADWHQRGYLAWSTGNTCALTLSLCVCVFVCKRVRAFISRSTTILHILELMRQSRHLFQATRQSCLLSIPHLRVLDVSTVLLIIDG
jgi:hypothetical protein